PPSIARITAAIEQATALRPNLSAALWLVEKTHHLPPGAALALIAVGRSAGWIAHAIEQREADAMIRPRAKFIRDAKPEPEPA
ncbi:MAG TPA: citrate/2-methylcitrate synthase, partial [Arenibaculum sp.]|nr:citrate/2-methylcitrate synthase [Arenibaculum sp.]